MAKAETDPLLSPKAWNSTHGVICLVAISQGVVGLADLALNYLYKDEYKLSPGRVSMINSICTIPWIIKPLWGFISDCCPILGKRRAPYLAIFGAVATLCWICMGTLAVSPWIAILTMLTVQVSTAFCNVIGEALVVEESQSSVKEDQASQNVSLFFGVRSVVVLLTAYTSGLLLEIVSKQTVFFITACFPMLLFLASALLKERRVEKHEKPKVAEQLSQIIGFVKRPDIFSPIAFIFLFMVIPTTSDAMFFYYTNKLKFAPEFMGRLKMAYGLASIVGIYSYNRWLKNVNFKSIFVWSSVVCAVAGCSQVMLVLRVNHYFYLPDSAFCLVSGFLVQAIGEMNALPVLVLCCKMCPKNVEGSMYALLMSTMNFGGLVSYQFGALLMWAFNITETNFHFLWIYVLVVNSLWLLPILFISMVPDRHSLKDKLHKSDEDAGAIV